MLCSHILLRALRVIGGYELKSEETEAQNEEEEEETK